MLGKTWVTCGTTESGDPLPILLWGSRKPTAEEADAAYRERLPFEFEEVGHVHVTIKEAEIVRED